MKKIAMLIVCVFLVAFAVNDVSANSKYHKNRHQKKWHHKHPNEAVPGAPVIECMDLLDFNYPGADITEVTFSEEGGLVDLGNNVLVPMPATASLEAL